MLPCSTGRWACGRWTLLSLLPVDLSCVTDNIELNIIHSLVGIFECLLGVCDAGQ